MKKSILKCVTCFLALIFLLSATVGCADSDTKSDDTGVNTSDGEVTTEGNGNDMDTLGEYDFGGAKYRILARESTVAEFDSTEKTYGDAVSQAVFTREVYIEERFKVDIEVDKIGCWWPQGNDLSQCPWYVQYGNITMAGISDYEMITGHQSICQIAAVNGYCKDLTTLEGIDLEKEWWSKEFYETCNLDGRMYVAMGDIAHTLYADLFVVFFNESLSESYLNDVDLYQMVEDGEWTWENYKKFILEVNEIGVEEGQKTYGYATINNACRSYATAFEVDYALPIQNGDHVTYNFPQNPIERTQNIMDELRSFFGGSTTAGSATDVVKLKMSDKDLNALFADGKALFITQRLGQVSNFADKLLNDGYGVLPYPKYNEDQLEYHTDVYDGTSAITVPTNVGNTKLAGVITEALCMYGYIEIRPEYLDDMLQGRYASDERMAQMIDTIRESFTMNFFAAYSGAIGSPHVFAATDSMIGGSIDGYATYYAGYRLQYQKRLEKFYQAYDISY